MTIAVFTLRGLAQRAGEQSVVDSIETFVGAEEDETRLAAFRAVNLAAERFAVEG